MKNRFRVLGRWPSTPPGDDPIKFDVNGKDLKDKKAVLAFIGFMMDNIPPYQISITDLKQFEEYNAPDEGEDETVQQTLV